MCHEDMHERLVCSRTCSSQSDEHIFVIAILTRIKAEGGREREGRRERRVWPGPPASRAAPSPALSPPSLQGSEQLGEYNHGGNATGQADKRGLGAGPRRRWGLSVCLFIWLSVKITVLRANGGLGQPVYRWSREKGQL